MFELDKTLAKDTQLLGSFELCLLLWVKDKNYPWAILVPKVESAVEVFDLLPEQQLQLNKESNLLSQSMHQVFNARKMNVAALGNIVSQLHIHHIVRYQTDKAWPGPVWGANPAQAYQADEIDKITQPLLSLLESKSTFVSHS